MAFKVGDQVRIGPKNGGYEVEKTQGLFPGNTGTIAGVIREGTYSVRTDNAEEPDDGRGVGWTFFEGEIESVVSA